MTRRSIENRHLRLSEDSINVGIVHHLSGKHRMLKLLQLVFDSSSFSRPLALMTLLLGQCKCPHMLAMGVSMGMTETPSLSADAPYEEPPWKDGASLKGRIGATFSVEEPLQGGPHFKDVIC